MTEQTSEVSKPAVRVDVYSHGVKVSGFDDHLKRAILQFCMQRLGQMGLVQVGRGKFNRQVVKIFAGADRDRTEFRFHRNSLEELLTHLQYAGLSPESIQVVQHPIYTPAPAEITYISHKTPRDYQIPLVEFMTAEGDTKVCTLQTGKGKGVVSMSAMAVLKTRVAVVVRPMYMEKWRIELIELLGLKPQELLVVQGGKNFRALIELAQAGELDAKVLLISNKAIQNYIKTWNTFGEESPFLVPPEKLYETLGVGVRVIDEVHQDFHLNFKQDCYAHVPKTLDMSATLVSDDPFMNRMYAIKFPKPTHAPAVAYDKYIVVTGLWYRLDDKSMNFVRTKNAQKQYSHVMFEQSIMRQKWLLKNYVGMLADLTDRLFVDIMDPTQKCLVYCATIKLCTIVRDELRRRFPTLEINRYTGEEPLELLMKSDIGVTTLQSAGTALDIPNLRVVIMSTALSSKQANEQVVGRLRKLGNFPDVTPEFYFLSAENIPKHMEYTAAKRAKLDGKVLAFREKHTGYRI